MPWLRKKYYHPPGVSDDIKYPVAYNAPSAVIDKEAFSFGIL